MGKNNEKLRNLKKKISQNILTKSLFNSKDLKKSIEDSIKLKKDIIANKLNLVSREEFEVQKKTIEKLQKDLNKFRFRTKKNKSNKKTIKAKKF